MPTIADSLRELADLLDKDYKGNLSRVSKELCKILSILISDNDVSNS